MDIDVERYRFRPYEGLGLEDLPIGIEPERLTVAVTEEAPRVVTLYVRRALEPGDDAEGIIMELSPENAARLASALTVAVDAVRRGSGKRDPRSKPDSAPPTLPLPWPPASRSIELPLIGLPSVPESVAAYVGA
jgi:hypothetical protein